MRYNPLMTNHESIYLTNGQGTDPSIFKGLTDAGYNVHITSSFGQALRELPGKNYLLVAEVQSGAIALLTLLREGGAQLPPTMLFDRDGHDLHPAIKALELGVRDYVLASDPPKQRELQAQLFAESLAAKPASIIHTSEAVPETKTDLRWDSDADIIYIKDAYIKLSPTEGRLFDLLVTHPNQIVTAEELEQAGLKNTSGTPEHQLKLLRPLIMHLRQKLAKSRYLERRVISVRGKGYMFV